jgi:hypothetical protein
MQFILMFCVMLISGLYMFICIVVSRRASDRGTEAPQVEDSEQELAEGKLYP